MSESNPLPRIQSTKSKRLRMYLGFAVSLICFWWVFRSLEQEQMFETIRSVSYWWLGIAVVATLSSYFVRSIRWPIFFQKNPPGLSTSFVVLIIGFFMNNILPARIGELVRAHLGGKETKQSRSSVLATIAGERLADGLMISLLFAVLFPLFPVALSSERGLTEMYFVAFLFLLVAVFTITTLICRQHIFRLLTYLQEVMPGHLSHYSLLRMRFFIEGLTPLLQPRKAIRISLLSLCVWSIELFAYYCVTRAFNVSMSLGGLSLFLAAVNFSSLIPAAPAGAGVIEMFGTLALERIGVNRETAFAMVATQHLIQIAVVGIPGSFFFFSRLGGKLPETEEDLIDSEMETQELPFRDISSPRPLSYEDAQDLPGVSDQESCELSVVVPAYNEALRITRALEDMQNYLEEQSYSYEVLVVDDGSSDDTIKVVQDFCKQHPEFRLLTYAKNRGKGYAVRFGVYNARGLQILFADADGATPFQELARLQLALSNGAQIAIGSRAMHSRETAVSTVWYRKYIGRIFNGIVNLLLLPGIADTQCGFKLFKRNVALPIFSRQRAERFSFDAEILFLARKGGCRIAEVPVNWTNIPGSKVNLIKDSLAMFRDLLKFRLRDIFGGYGQFDLRAETLETIENPKN